MTLRAISAVLPSMRVAFGGLGSWAAAGNPSNLAVQAPLRRQR